MKRLLLSLVTMMACTAAWAGVAYAEYSNGTLTFRYDANLNSVPPGCFAIDNVVAPDWNIMDLEKSVTKVLFDPSFVQARPKTTRYWFYNMENLTTIEGLEYLITTEVITMDRMFKGCKNLTSINWGNNLNTWNVTDMSEMFYDCLSLTSLDLRLFKTPNVTDMSAMFQDCASLTSLNVSSFDTRNVTNMSSMFNGCSSLTSLNVSLFNTARVTDMSSMFSGCSSLTSLDLSSVSFITSNVTSMEFMFSGCSSLTSLDLSKFDTSKVTTMHRMFTNCSSLTSLNVSSFNTDNVTVMAWMFTDCSSLPTLDLSNFTTANVTSMFGMFQECSKLTSLDLSNFNTSNVTNMSRMFNACKSLTSINMSGFNTTQVTNMSEMFRECEKLTSLDLGGFNTAKVTDMGEMFYYCRKLKKIYVGNNWTAAGATESSRMFDSCYSLVGGAGTTYNDNHVDGSYAHIDGGSSNPGYLTLKLFYDVWINGQQVANSNCEDLSIITGVSGTVTYEPSNTTLTLNDATIVSNVNNGIGIKSTIDGLTIKLIERNVLIAENGIGTRAMSLSTTIIKGPGTLGAWANNSGILVRGNKTLTIDHVPDLYVESKYGIYASDSELFRAVVKGSNTVVEVSGSSCAMGGMTELVLNDGLKITEPVGGYFNNHAVCDASGKIATHVTIGGSLVGDVNGDGKVNVTDVTTLVNMILGVIPKDMERGNINGDDKINVTDVTALINIILGVNH